MPNRGHYRQPHDVWVERAGCLATPDSPAASGAGVSGDAYGPVAGAAGELHAYRGGEFGDKSFVVLEASPRITLAASFPDVTVCQTLLLGSGDRVGFSEDALPFVPLTRLAPLHDHLLLGGPAVSTAGSPRSQWKLTAEPGIERAPRSFERQQGPQQLLTTTEIATMQEEQS